MAAAAYEEQQVTIRCDAAKETEQRLSMMIAHCHDLQQDFEELRQLATRVLVHLVPNCIYLIFIRSALKTRLEAVEKALL